MGRSLSNFIAFLSPFSLRYKEALGRRDWGRGLWQSLPCPCMVMCTIQLGPRNAGWNVCILPYHYQLFLLNSSQLLTRLAWLARSRTLITKETKNKRNCQPIICFKSASEAYHFPFFWVKTESCIIYYLLYRKPGWDIWSVPWNEFAHHFRVPWLHLHKDLSLTSRSPLRQPTYWNHWCRVLRIFIDEHI